MFQADKHKLNQACPCSLLNAQGNSPAQESHLQTRRTERSTTGAHSQCEGWVLSLSLEDFSPKHPWSTHPAHSTSMAAWTDPGGENQSRAPLTTSKTHLPKEQKHTQAPDYPKNTKAPCSRHLVCSDGEQSRSSAEEPRPRRVCSI